jgi:hypothetical protein
MPATRETHFIGSPYDTVRNVVYGDHLPKERAGYILARYALSQCHDGPHFDSYAILALRTLTDEETAAEHQPPVSDELRELTQELLEKRTGTGHDVDLSVDAALLLAWAVDEGERGSNA